MKTKMRRLPEALERRVSLTSAERNEEKRSVRAALSSETPVQRPFGQETLVHTKRAIDLRRAEGNGLPLLINHDDGALPIGRVRNITLDDDRVLRGDLEFSEATQTAREAWDLAREGTLSDVSIRYRINNHKVRGRDSDNPQYDITSWTLLEASVVSVPADAAVGIGRNLTDGGTTMPEEQTETAPVVPTDDILEQARAVTAAADNAGVRAERARQATINALAGNFAGNQTVQALARTACDNGTPVESFKESLIVALAGTPAEPLARTIPQPELGQPVVRGGSPFQTSTFVAGDTDVQKWARAVEEALNVRAGNVAHKDAADNPFIGYSLTELARMSLEKNGVSTRGLSPMDVAGMALTRYIEPGTANLTTASYPAILENVLNKSLFTGFDEAPVTWSTWCGTGSSRDFKQGTRPGVSQFTSLEVVAENGEVQDGITTDKKEVFQVQTFARKYSITRQALVNDDLGALTDTAAKMGGAAARTIDEQVYAYVESNPTMNEDALELFDATPTTGHGNLISGANPPSTSTISTARTVMGKQTDWNSVILGIVPQYMVVPLEIEEEMLVLRTTSVDPDATNLTRNNVYQQLWTPVSSPRLTSATAWYMFGARGEHIDVIFLNGAQRPMLARDEGWSVLAAHWRVVLDFTVMAVDWRSAIKFLNA